ncbi:MAG: hypothetical protein Q8K65_11650 [Alphaproteobacteria bacterium]|nr:hypothetical protein [Alphaproteobacteria bacterium]
MSEPKTDKPEKKKFTERLRDLFRRKAKPAPVPPEVYNDKRVKKAVFKANRRRFYKRILLTSVAAAAISTGTHYAPDSVSTPFNTYMTEKGHAENFHDHFHAKNIRVYDRWNPLYPFHLAGQGVKITWSEIDQDKESGNAAKAFGKAVTTPIVYYSMLFKGVGDLILPHPIDAYALSGNAPHDQREVFIRPPKAINLDDFISDFGRVNTAEMTFKNDTAELERVIFEYIMLHEARHGDQNKGVAVSLNEADADRYAFDVLAARGNKTELLSEARAIITHSRTMSSVLGGGTSHTTSVALLRPYATPYNAYRDEAALSRLHKVLSDADIMNKDAFPEDMSRGNRFVYMAAALKKQGLAARDPDMQMATDMFLNAAGFFNEASGGAIIDRSFNIDKINMGYLQQQYKPVEDKLAPKAEQQRPAPRPPRPTS